jgi:hypothetical protein
MGKFFLCNDSKLVQGFLQVMLVFICVVCILCVVYGLNFFL